MKYFEFGQQNDTLMVLLHGGGVCYKGVLPVAERLLYPDATWQSWKNQDACLIAEHTEQFIDEVKAVHVTFEKEQ